ncbi:hypothetical protein CMUS01_16444 [Colletotrichum musicola]|uniref:Cyanovirin-N domain-containing protein n=1 Tax=Colletotrichum musicola TaxID=2175873 RepID=A0A8H6INS7_9PEZI|nr:hypothetical protein CMUS01_16444 [Colletotrichum musicola]
MLAAKITTALLAIAPALALASPAPVANNPAALNLRAGDDEISLNSFAGSCRACRIDYVSLLHCECRNTAGQWVLSSFDVGTCFRNDQCWLRWQRNGGAFQSCRNARIVDGFTLAADCRAGDGAWCANRVNLNERIHNRNGNMACD